MWSYRVSSSYLQYNANAANLADPFERIEDLVEVPYLLFSTTSSCTGTRIERPIALERKYKRHITETIQRVPLSIKGIECF